MFTYEVSKYVPLFSHWNFPLGGSHGRNVFNFSCSSTPSQKLAYSLEAFLQSSSNLLICYTQFHIHFILYTTTFPFSGNLFVRGLLFLLFFCFLMSLRLTPLLSSPFVHILYSITPSIAPTIDLSNILKTALTPKVCSIISQSLPSNFYPSLYRFIHTHCYAISLASYFLILHFLFSLNSHISLIITHASVQSGQNK